MKGNPDCTECGLHRSAQAVCLMGRGPVPGEVMIVGEAPGFREDDIGKPFAGDAGNMLDTMLSEVDLSREDCYITNVCKCRPPDNRTPKSGEVKACKPYLLKEFNKVKPKYVLLLGATALKGVIGKGKITEDHGTVIEKEGVYYLPTFHPAAAMRDPNKLPSIKGDIARFSGLVKSGSPPKPPETKYEVIRNFEDFNRCVSYIEKQKYIAFDLETSQLSRKGGGDSYVNCIALGTSGKQYVLPLESEQLWDHSIQTEMLSIMSEALGGKVVVAHNGKFDNLWLREKYGVRFPLSFDTMLASHLLDENTPNGLKYLAKVKFGAPDYDISKESKQGKGSLEELYKYNAMDIYYTAKLYKLFKKELKEDGALYKVFKYISMGMSDVYEDAEFEGIVLDTEQMQEVERELRSNINKVKRKLAKYTKKKDVNWNSPQQVAEVLFKEWGLQPIDYTDTGAPSTEESLLKRLSKEHKGVELLLEYRGYAKQLSSFIEGWRKRMDGGRIFPSYKIHGTVTGRPSCTDPNLQQVPRDPKIRSLITAPPGWVFVEADHSQIELRVTAMMSGDRTMKFVYQTGGDIHRETAQTVMSKQEIDADERKKAKAVNFGFIYGMGAPKFQDYARDKYGMDFTLNQCKAFRTRYFEKYADLPKWHEKQRKIARAFGQVRTYTGRIRHLPEIHSSDKGKRAEAERQSINSPVQGFAAEVTLMGAIEVSKRFSWEDEVRVVGTVHDAILMYIKEEKLHDLAPQIAEAMEHPSLFDKFKLDLPVPLKAELKAGPWGKGEDII